MNIELKPKAKLTLEGSRMDIIMALRGSNLEKEAEAYNDSCQRTIDDDEYSDFFGEITIASMMDAVKIIRSLPTKHCVVGLVIESKNEDIDTRVWFEGMQGRAVGMIGGELKINLDSFSDKIRNAAAEAKNILERAL